MKLSGGTRLPEILKTHEQSILNEWMQLQVESTATRRDLMSEAELQRQSRDFLNAFVRAAETGRLDDVHGMPWAPVREMLSRVSEARALLGFSPAETATFVFSLKQPLFRQLRENVPDANRLVDEIWTTTAVLDALGLHTADAYQKARNEIITRQQQEMLELSTPVVTLWDGILALPLIGTLDSARTQVVMENLLQRIVETGSLIAILDITGVPTVDTLVAQHLLKTVAAARLMGADCIISGIRPQIAQTIVHLGVDLNAVIDQGDAGGCVCRRAQAHRIRRRSHRPEGVGWRGGLAPPRARDSMERIPILKMGAFLLVSIQVDMHDRLAMQLQDDLTDRIAETGAQGVLIDISALEMVDSFIGRMLGNIAAMSRVLDAETVVVGMRPAVAITLVELGMSLPGVRTALNVERGMDSAVGVARRIWA